MKVRLDRIVPALERPAGDVRLFLLHGPDEAGAMALADRLGRAIGAGSERVQLDGATLRADPARLADEAAAISLFGTPRWVRVTAAGDESAAAVEALLASAASGSPVVMIAPAVRTTSRLVKLAEASAAAMAYACYVPDERQGEALVIDMARAAGLRLERSVARRLFVAADGDRAIVSSEIEKLALYLDAAPERPRDVDDGVLSSVGAGEPEGDVDALIAAIIAALPSEVAARLSTLTNADASAIPWLRAFVRRLTALADMRARLEGGEAMDTIVARAHFMERKATAAVLRGWTASDIARALVRVRRIERAVMGSGGAGPQLAAHELLRMARR